MNVILPYPNNDYTCPFVNQSVSPSIYSKIRAYSGPAVGPAEPTYVKSQPLKNIHI